MKNGAFNHTKMRRLERILSLARYESVGILECLWDLAKRESYRGDIGRLADEEICDHLGWRRGAGELIEALVTSGWLDHDDTFRLLIHDWPEHCEDSIHAKVARSRELVFADGSKPKLTKLSVKERDDYERRFRECGGINPPSEFQRRNKSAGGGIKPPALALPSLSHAMPSLALEAAADAAPPKAHTPPSDAKDPRGGISVSDGTVKYNGVAVGKHSPVTTYTESGFDEFNQPEGDFSGEDQFDFFRQTFNGEIRDDTYQAFIACVNTPEKWAQMKRNLPLWMQTAKYRDGSFLDGTKYLRSGSWKHPPPAAMLRKQTFDPYEAAQ